MFHPRAYISYSQMALWEMHPRKYIAQYMNKERQYVNKNMHYGSKFAKSLELDEASGDPILDLMASRIPKFEIMDQPIQIAGGFEVWFERDKKNVKVPVLDNGGKGGVIPLLAIPDSMKADMSAFLEYKTSVRKWTQKMADDSGQITFYATTMWLVTHQIPEDIALVNVPVTYTENGGMTPTNDLVILKTKRTMVDLIKMTKRIRNAWQEISDACEKEMF